MTTRSVIGRLELARAGQVPWKKWGPYLSERQWGTVREDYSTDGNAWSYFTHDQARSRAYRWGEDGLAGISDDRQILCFSLALWNGKDPILKERLFGLSNVEGNHGEDVKEYYFYLDSSPNHAYMKYLYKYPQALYPYEELVEVNRSRTRDEFEYELVDTGVFDENRYFDVFVEYAKAAPEDILIKITVWNRGPEDSVLHVLPTLLFRNTWSWSEGAPRPVLKEVIPSSCENGTSRDTRRTSDAGAASDCEYSTVLAYHTAPQWAEQISDYYFYCKGAVSLLFCDNDTNNVRIFGTSNLNTYVKDGINEYVVNNRETAVNQHGFGTKVSPHYKLNVKAGASKTIWLRLRRAEVSGCGTSSESSGGSSEHKSSFEPFSDFEEVFATRLKETDEFYNAIMPPELRADADRANVYRQSLAGMLWSKQYFYYDVDRWLKDHGHDLLDGVHQSTVRNSAWHHMYNDDIISMPDKWEYPWYAAWDLAFHTVPFGVIDPDFAKQQLDLMLRNDYQHPNGQLPAYEWNFSDVNPPVHALVTLEIYLQDKAIKGEGDINFLKYAFTKLMVNYSWWINRKDPQGRNVFEGGFLGLDNISVFDRSSPLPTGGTLEQADGTAWMVIFSQAMLAISIELALNDPLYEDFALKFFQHTVWIAGVMDRPGQHRDELWDEQDGFFYDVLRLPNNQSMRLKVRSMVGLLPLVGTVLIEESQLEKLPTFRDQAYAFSRRHPNLCANIHLPWEPGVCGRRMIAVANDKKLRRILTRMLDESEFFGPFGIRSMSKYHKENPFVFNHGEQEFRVDYLPAESNTGMFGGNSNWRGPVWMPVNFILLRTIWQYYGYFGDSFKIECPTGSGNEMTLFEVGKELSGRLSAIFLKGPDGRRPVYGSTEKFQNDPHWRDLILFYEYFHADNGAGLGASHQTGWTGLISRILRLDKIVTKEALLSGGGWEEVRKMLITHSN